jgi:hypothetical protein
LAGFAAEAAALGKPAVVGGYRLHELELLVPEGMFPTSHMSKPEGLKETIRKLASSSSARRNSGLRAQHFIRSSWTAEKVSHRFHLLLNGQIPSDWWVDPNEVIYVYGAGQSREVTRRQIRGLVENCGVSALQIDHHPELLRAMLEFAGLDSSPR